MRVIAGTAKGTRLVAPRLRQLRATTDAMRETLFNVLAERIVGARFLDLFAGCGAVGIEALSRGAEWCTFVEVSPRCVRAIRENLERARLGARAEVHRRDAARAVRRVGERESYDIVFADPPYGYEGLAELVTAVPGQREASAEGGVVVIQHARRASLPDEPTPDQVKRFGESVMSFYW
ncbi:MAG: 16S rRNA (guanine(966)-N(2))-methyltransferase RsmD [Armatimonadota bacterium]|jgi:16S rRNA (guanine(966)-N(2))-methyltransferase RsmD